MPRFLWPPLVLSVGAFVYLVYLAMKVTAIFALVGVVVVFWLIIGWKIRKIIKKRS